MFGKFVTKLIQVSVKACYKCISIIQQYCLYLFNVIVIANMGSN